MFLMNVESVRIQTIQADWLQLRHIQFDVLRLDEIHNVVSGNKLFKMHFYLQEAIVQQYETIATFGGAFSNHIVAVAYACNNLGIKTIGIIRGEEPADLSHTLLQAKSLGMQLHFVSRDFYKHKEEIKKLYPDVYWINEGGYGIQGAEGAALLLQYVPNLAQYTHIICAVGTGTTLAGVLLPALPHQTILGVSSLKGAMSLKEEVRKLLPAHLQNREFFIAHGFHFGGYGKYDATLIEYMNTMWQQHGLPSDFVYTAKALYGTQAMIFQQIIPVGSCVLVLHTGGLQGNLSLPPGTLTF